MDFLSSAERMTLFFFSPARYSRNEVTSNGWGEWSLCPDASPLALRPSIEKGRTSPPQRQRRPLIGREKRRLTSPHFIILGKESEAIMPGSAPASTSSVGRPLVVFFRPTYSPRGVG